MDKVQVSPGGYKRTTRCAQQHSPWGLHILPIDLSVDHPSLDHSQIRRLPSFHALEHGAGDIVRNLEPL
jgi:hypothetical protein